LQLARKIYRDLYLDFFVGERGKKWDLMREVLLDRFHFDGKIATMEVLVKKSAGADFKKQYGKLFGELRYIKEQRNFLRITYK
jgi:hypothetical protein